MNIHKCLWEINKIPYKLFKDSIDKEIYNEVKNIIKKNYKKLNVLDLGCGDGELGEKLLDIAGKIVMVDFSENAIKKCRVKMRGKHTLCVAEDIVNYLKMTKERFDVIIMCRSLHDRNPKKIIDVGWKRLMDGGIIVIVTPKKSLMEYCQKRGKFSIKLLIKTIIPRFLNKLKLVNYNLLSKKELNSLFSNKTQNINIMKCGEGTHILFIAKKQ